MDNHTKALDDLCARPHLIGIERVIWVAKEMKMFEGKQLICEPDLIFYNGRLYVIEYKASLEHQGRALEQLDRASALVSEYFGGHPVKMFVWGGPYYEYLRI